MMFEELIPRLYRIIIPPPNSPLKELNSYVIKADDRNLIIDTGFNRSVCFEAMQEGLRALDIDLSKTDFMLTHMHADHIGLISKLVMKTSTVYFSRIDARVFDKDISWQPMIDYAVSNGFQLEYLLKALKNHPGFKYSPETIPEFNLLDDNDFIKIGDYHLKCLLTPGHTEGHICLYEEKKQILFSGDDILYDITPHIESWSYEVTLSKIIWKVWKKSEIHPLILSFPDIAISLPTLKEG